MTTEKITIFPKNRHIKVSMYALSTIGVWPLKLDNYPIARRIYTFYSNFLYYYCVSFVIRQFIEFFRLLFARNITRLMQNCSLSLLTAISTIRTTAVRGKIIQGLILKIIEIEDRIMASKDKKIIKIYKFYVLQSTIAQIFFILVGVVAATPFYFGPMAEEHAYPELYKPNNVTGKIRKRAPLSAWLPYDVNDHYWFTFVWQIADGWTAECYVVYTDALLFGMIIFASGQIRILQHIFKNFREYSLKTQKQLSLTTYDEAAYATIRACVIFHKEIIFYVEELNRALKNLMLLDFASCSIQMAVLVFQVIMSDINVPMLFAVLFLIAMVIQLFLFYFNANEITFQSLLVPDAIGHSNWYEEPEKVKHALQFVIMKTQRPLCLQIGPFYPMSTNAALSILKATYSYAMLLRQSYLRRLGVK